MPVFLRFLTVCLCALALAIPSPADAQGKRKNTKKYVPGYGSIVIDAQTGDVLIAENPDRSLHPASLTKMMTLLLTFDALAQQRIKTTDYIKISARAAAASPSKLGIRAGGRIEVDDAIRAIAIKSANDISLAMAEGLAGSQERFVARMNARAKEIGMTRTRFVNAHGLHAGGQVSTPRDMALLARYIIVNYPQYYKYFGLRSFNYAGRNHPNHNKLMNTYAGMDGMKTGYISQSGFNLVASAVRRDRRLIGVVFGGRTGSSRNARMAELLDRGFHIPAKKGKGDKINVAALPPLEPEQGSTSMVVPPRKPGQNAVSYDDGFAGASDGATDMAAITPMPDKWSVQLGAYQERAATDTALHQAVTLLPADLQHASPVVAPIKTLQSGWLFRARLGNLTEFEAKRICTYFRGCLMIAPDGERHGG